MGSGKTSVGEALSEQQHCSFVDLDHRVESREGRTVAQIFRDSGEDGFRKAEHSALRELVEQLPGSQQPVVVALGGGAFAQPANGSLIKDAGCPVIFLDAPPSELLRRCRQQKLERPLSHDEQRFQELYEQRKPHYLKADLRVDTLGREVKAIAEEIAARLTAQTRSAKEK